MSSIFKSPAARDALVEWSERFRRNIPHPTESRTVATRFGETHVLVGGPAGAPPVVLLHGAMASSAHVLGELPALLERFRVYAVDVVGQSARSADTRPSVANDDYGHWLSDVFDALGLAGAHLLGVSWGGFVAQRFAAVAPERVDRLVLMVPAGLVKTPAWAGFAKMGWPMARFMMSPTDANLRGFMSNLLTTLDDDWLPYMGVAFRSFEMNMKVPKCSEPAEFKGFRAPVFVVAADADVSFPGSAVLARARQVFPAVTETELLAGVKHSPPTTPEFRARMAARIATFLAG